ncbi:LTA synthase family protein [Lederbergia sp. NSJ-179]|uniref:LTA synthase family protein n=1 Tax=Lederbergia sp. NSJ-179 TaxID=2931402 RepID=UPI001FD3798F|nr:LTA synthase family protein [Lederbergia sp. NSJ-179]MCJ7843504.1 LTA synthase family protein [Lederbergia sp. NSJ-179]
MDVTSMIQKVPSAQNRDRWIYLFSVLLLCLKISILYKWGFQISVQSFWEAILLEFTTLGSLLAIFSLGFLSKRHRTKIFFTIHLLLTAILYGNVLYYRFYIDFVTVPVLFQFKNVGGLSQSTLELIKFYDVFLFLDVILLFIMAKHRLFKQYSLSIPKKVGKTVIPFLIIVPILLSCFFHSGFWNQSYDKELIVKSLGLYYYHMFDIYQNSKSSMKSVLADGSEVKEIERYVKKKREHDPLSELHGVAKGKNVIVIFLESTQEFVMDREIDGQEITPFLNEFKKESLYFPNFYHQTAQGKTSDAEFILDNSLYPLSGGSVFVRRTNNHFVALPEILKQHQYYSASFHGNDAFFWNREIAYQTFGYDRFFSKEDYDVTEENSINYGLKDIDFFKQSLPYLSQLPEPYYAKFLTLTNHFPFLLDPEDQLISAPETEQNMVNRYFTTVRYEDEAIKNFFDDIKQSDIYDNSIFVLFGDHYGISKSYNDALGEVLGYQITPKDDMELQKVPLFIHIPGIKGQEVTTVGGQMDLRATILDLLGISEPEEALSFGKSLLTHDKNRFVAFRDGSFTTNKYSYIEHTCYSKKTGKKVKRNFCSPYFSDIQKELNYSDKVINGDLLRFLE